MRRDVEATADWLRERLGARVLCDVVALDDDARSLALHPEEDELVAHAVPARRREFAAGRACARGLLARLGFAPGPLLRARDRVPAWPRGAVGSIAHDGDVCAVLVARSAAIEALGVDVEPDLPLEEQLWDVVCAPEELERVREAPRAERGRLARAYFGAKECAYKALYPLARAELEFADVAIELDRGTERFRASIRGPHAERVRDARKGRDDVEGVQRARGGSIVSAVALHVQGATVSRGASPRNGTTR